MVSTFLENTSNLGIFTYQQPDRGKLFIPLGSVFLENLLPPTAERGGKNYDLLYQNSIRKYEDDLEH